MKCEEACKLVDAEGGGGATINTTKKNKSESYSINDDVNDYGDWKPSNKSSNNYSESNNTASNDYSSLDYGSSSNSSISEESNDTSESSSSWDDNDSSDNSSWWDNDDTSESSSSWDDDTSDNSSWWDNDDTSESSSSWDDDTSNNSSSWDDNDMSESSSWWNDYTSDNSSWWDNDDTSENSNSVEVEFDNKTSNYLVNDDQIPNNHNSWQENISNKGQQGLDYSEKIEDKTEETITPNETLVSFEDKAEPQIPVNPSENENSMLTDNSQDQINVIVDAPSIEVVSSETNLTPASNSTNETITDTNADMLNADTKTINDIPAEQHEETNTDKINISENNPILEDAAESSLVNTSNPEIIPIDSGASTTANSDGTPQKMENTPIESVDSKEGIVHEHKTHILDTPQIIDDTPYHPVNKKEEPINTEASNTKSIIKEKDSTKEHTTHILDTPQMIDDKPYHPINKKEEPINTEASNAKSFIKKKEKINFNSENLKNGSPGKTNKIEQKTISTNESARMALLNKRKSSEDDFYNDLIGGGIKKDILDRQIHKKNSSFIIAKDIRGQDVTFDDFKVDGMDISIKREHDGYGNKFDSVRTIETVRLANGQVVKCNIQDMVGANAKSKEFADEHKGRILPDGKYFFTAAGLTKQKDDTYNSACFQNTLRLQTRDSNIPEHIRNDINSKYFLFHATEYKEGYIPEEGKCRIWINPWSAGCISSITGGQATHDDFMNMLTGITPENISITITSKKHVNI